MIELSNNEAASLIKLAARGVGYPWGLGEEAAHASRWLVERQLPALEQFKSLFAWVDEREFSQLILQCNDERWCCTRDELCPLICGSAILDSASMLLTVDKVELSNVVCPLLLIPFISEASVALKKSIQMSWKDEELVFNGTCVESVSDSDGLLTNSDSTGSLSSVCISVISEAVESQGTVFDASTCELWPVVMHSRVKIDQICLESLKQYAHRTYAPATELSRLSGAGAGTSDND
ncbi:MAG: hypothetical protein ACI8VW_002513 [bacterium]|jgi:hypothetical protein